MLSLPIGQASIVARLHLKQKADKLSRQKLTATDCDSQCTRSVDALIEAWKLTLYINVIIGSGTVISCNMLALYIIHAYTSTTYPTTVSQTIVHTPHLTLSCCGLQTLAREHRACQVCRSCLKFVESRAATKFDCPACTCLYMYAHNKYVSACSPYMHTALAQGLNPLICFFYQQHDRLKAGLAIWL